MRIQLCFQSILEVFYLLICYVPVRGLFKLLPMIYSIANSVGR